MKDGADTELLARLHDGLAAAPPLRLAVLFGSGVRGELRADSDLDVAIEPVDLELSLAQELDLQLAFERATGRSVHLVRLDRAPLLLRWRIALEGQVLAADPCAGWPRFRACTASEYADFAPALEEAAHRYRRLLAGAFPQAPRRPVALRSPWSGLTSAPRQSTFL